MSIQSFCKKNNIKFVEFSLENQDKKIYINPVTGHLNRVENCVLSIFQNYGWSGCSSEAELLLTLIKAMSFADIEPYYCDIYTEALYAKNIAKISFYDNTIYEPYELLQNVKSSTKETIVNNLNKIFSTNKFEFSNSNVQISLSKPSFANESEHINKELCLEFFLVSGKTLLYNIAKQFSEDPYTYRSGWPDITLWKDDRLVLLEVKTENDTFQKSQKIIINDFIKKFNIDYTVIFVNKLDAHSSSIDILNNNYKNFMEKYF